MSEHTAENDALRAAAVWAGRVIPPGEDDADLADTLRARLAADDGIRHDLDDVIEEFGFTREELEDDLPRVIPPAVGDAS